MQKINNAEESGIQYKGIPQSMVLYFEIADELAQAELPQCSSLSFTLVAGHHNR